MFVYADNAATTAVSKTALEAMLPAMQELYGNPSSLHQKGREANMALAAAREKVAKCLNAQPREIYFTGCGTESDNWAITEGARLGALEGKKHIISDVIEHHAVLHTLSKLEKQGFEVTYLPVHENGVVRLDELAAAIRPDTCLVTIMFSNNEIGTIQPIREAAEIAFGFQHEMTIIGGNSILPLIYSSFKAPCITLWIRFCRRYGVEALYHNMKHLYETLCQRDLNAAEAWVDEYLGEAIHGAQQIYDD